MLEHHKKRKLVLNKPSEEEVIWRYLSIDKFLHLLTSDTLFFAPATSFEDPFEGDYGETTKNLILHEYGPVQIERDKNTYDLLKAHTYISCWYKSEYESAAMWKIYGGSIAIKTTFGKIDKLLKWKEDEIRYSGRINYVDYEKDEIEASSSYISYFYKRKSFSHENEVRFLIQNYFRKQYNEYPNPSFGKQLKLNFNNNIEEIIYSPLMSKYIIESLEVVLEKLEINVPKKKSKLLDSPDWIGLTNK